MKNSEQTIVQQNKITDLNLPMELMTKYASLLENRTVRKILKNVSDDQVSYVLQLIQEKDEFGMELRMRGEVGKGKVQEVKEAFEELGFKVNHKKPEYQEKHAGIIKLSILYKDHATKDRGF